MGFVKGDTRRTAYSSNGKDSWNIMNWTLILCIHRRMSKLTLELGDPRAEA